MAISEWKSSIPIRHWLFAKNKKEAERRKSLFRNHRSLAGCGTHPR